MAYNFNDFFKYHDDLFSQWLSFGSHLWNDPYLLYSDKLLSYPYINLMPEGFYGNPEKCSIVFINLNPGYTPFDDEVMIGRRSDPRSLVPGKEVSKINSNGKYSDYFKTFPIGDSGYIRKNTYKWWVSRRDWLQRHLVMSSNADVNRNPFVIEICPWHSSKWNDAGLKLENKALVQHIDDFVIKPAMFAVANSVCRYALAVGNLKTYIEDLGFKQEHDPVMSGISVYSHSTWGSLKTGISWPSSGSRSGYNERKYVILSKHTNVENQEKSLKILFTSTQSSNKAPSSDFIIIEKEILHRHKLL